MKKKWIFVVSSFVLLGLSLFGFFFLQEKEQQKQKKAQQLAYEEEIKSHYASSVVIQKEADLYKKEKDDYKKAGKIGKGELVSLSAPLSSSAPYFNVKDTPYYLYYETVKPSTEKPSFETFDQYVPFSSVVYTKENASFLRPNQDFSFQIETSLELPVILKEEKQTLVKKGAEYFYINNTDIKKTEQKRTTEKKAGDHFGVLAYHFFYDQSGCDQVICTKKSTFEVQLSYLKQNGYTTLSMKDVERFLKGSANVPEKSVVLTIDDGEASVKSIAIPLLEKYQMKATLFVIAAWYGPQEFSSPNLEIASHGYNIHEEGVCNNSKRGSKLLCMKEEEAIADLKKSRQLLNNTTAFCYPFYEYNETAISYLKKAGFTLAFTGGNQVTRATNPYKIPRYTILSNTDMETFQYMIR